VEWLVPVEISPAAIWLERPQVWITALDEPLLRSQLALRNIGGHPIACLLISPSCTPYQIHNLLIVQLTYICMSHIERELINVAIVP
jgi:hypothetical protein